MVYMSGSAGLAAAKRRRGGSTADYAPQPPGGRTCRRNPQTGGVSCGPAGSQGAPGRGGGGQQGFVAHLRRQEARLRQLEASAGAGGEEGGGVSDEQVAAQVQAVAAAAFEEVAGRVTSLERAVSQAAPPEATDIAYFRNKTEEIETAVADLKRLLLKVQSFAMETNCTLMKLGARVDKAADSGASRAKERALEAWERSLEDRIDAAVQRKADELVAACPAHPHVSTDADAAEEDDEEEEDDDGVAHVEGVDEEDDVQVLASAT